MDQEEQLPSDGHQGQAETEHRENVDRLGIRGECQRKGHESEPKMRNSIANSFCTLHESGKQSCPDKLQDGCRNVKSKDARMAAWHRTNPSGRV